MGGTIPGLVVLGPIRTLLWIFHMDRIVFPLLVCLFGFFVYYLFGLFIFLLLRSRNSFKTGDIALSVVECLLP